MTAKKTLYAALLGLASSITSADQTLSGQFQLELSFGAAQSLENTWQAGVVVSQQIPHQRKASPVFSYSIDNQGLAVGKLFGSTITTENEKLNVDRNFSLSTVMMIAGFAAAGLVLAEQMTNDHKPATDNGGADSAADRPVDLPIALADAP